MPSRRAGVAQRFEDGRVAVDLGQRRFADVAGVDGQKSARIDVAHMRDEHEALAVVDAPRGPARGAGFGVGRGRACLVLRATLRMAVPVAHAAFFQVVLQQVAAVVHGLGGLDLEVDAVRESS